MKNYIVLLRGINISGKNKVDMTVLKDALAHAGFMNIHTYLNSGNILFSTSKKLIYIQDIITNILYENFGLVVPMIIMDCETINDYLLHAPSWWNQGNPSQYDQMIFVLGEMKAKGVYEQIGEPVLENEYVEVYKHMIFWSFPKEQYQKSSWWKSTAKEPIVNNVTIRKASTIRKLLSFLNN